jgi:hypothetical protein
MNKKNHAIRVVFFCYLISGQLLAFSSQGYLVIRLFGNLWNQWQKKHSHFDFMTIFFFSKTN